MTVPDGSGLAARLQQDISEIKEALGKITDSLKTLAVVEERVSVTQATLERAFGEVAKISLRVDRLEADMTAAKVLMAAEKVENGVRNIWVDRGIVAALVTAAQLAGRKMGLLP